MLDFYEAIKYVTSHASDLGVDVSKIAIAGKSLVSIADSAQTEYCTTFPLSVRPSVRPCVRHRRDISHLSHI